MRNRGLSVQVPSPSAGSVGFRRGSSDVLPRAPDEQVLAWPQVELRKNPFTTLAGGVGQAVSAEVDDCITDVDELDPVRARPGFVQCRHGVDRKQLVDHHLSVEGSGKQESHDQMPPG